MLRQVPFPIFCILLWFASVNNVESLSTLQDRCLEFDIADLEKYVSTLNFANVPTVDTMFAGFECPITALPFGFLRSDWARLLLLRKMLEEESIFAEKLERLMRILIIAYQRIEQGIVPNKYLIETNDGNSVPTRGFVFNSTTKIAGTVEIVTINHGDIKEMEQSENRNKQEDVVENATTQFSTNHLTVTDFLDNEVGSFSTVRVNYLSGDRNLTSKVKKNSTCENQKEEIVKHEKNEKDLVTSSKSSTPINFEIASMVNSRSTVKFNRFGASTEKFNSIDSLPTVQTKIFEEIASQEDETKRTTGYTFNFHDSDDGGNRNIKDDRNFAFTTLPSGSSMNTEASANGRTDFNSFDTDREKIKNDKKVKVSPFTSDNTVTISPESADSYADTILTTTSGNILSTTLVLTSSESVNTEGNIKANADRSFVASIKASTNSDPTRSTVSDVTNRQDLKETISNEVSISGKDNLGNTSSAVRNSADYLDPSLNSIYDVLAQESDKLDVDIDEPRRIIRNKLKKLSVLREQPPTNVMNVYEEISQRSMFSSKTTTLSRNSIEATNESKESPLDSRKRGSTNTNIENNFRFFYNFGGRLAARIKTEEEASKFIRVKCKEEST